MAQQTAMQQLLAQLKDERQKLPMHIEWDRCYQSIEMVIKNTYLQIEKEQMEITYETGWVNGDLKKAPRFGSDYYKETFKK